MVWSKELGHRSVERDIKRFCGFKALKGLLEDCPTDIVKLLVLSLFKTGGRISEVLDLTGDMFDFEYREGVIVVLDMPVRKRRKFVKVTDEEGKIKTVLVKDPDKTRDIAILDDEELTYEWKSLIPSTGKLFGFKYDKSYQLIRDLQKPINEKHGPWYPHRFRAERARQLVRDYRYNAMDLKTFFEMGRLTTPLFYAKPALDTLILKMRSKGR